MYIACTLSDGNAISARVTSAMEGDLILAVAAHRRQTAKELHDAATELRERLDSQKADVEFWIMLSANGALTADDKRELQIERDEVKGLLAKSTTTFLDACKQIGLDLKDETAREGARKAGLDHAPVKSRCMGRDAGLAAAGLPMVDWEVPYCGSVAQPASSPLGRCWPAGRATYISRGCHVIVNLQVMRQQGMIRRRLVVARGEQ